MYQKEEVISMEEVKICSKCGENPVAQDVGTGEDLNWCQPCIREWVRKNLMSRQTDPWV